MHVSISGGSTSGQQWALPPPSLMVCLPSCIILIFFAQALLPMYNAANDVGGWKRLEIIFEIMN